MKRKSIAAGAAAVLVIGGGAWAGLGSATATTAHPSIHGWPTSTASAGTTIASVKADAAGSGSQVLLLHEHGVRAAFIDVGASGQSAGDYFMFESQLMYQGHSQVIGRDSGRCTFGPRTVICDATVQLFGKGKIVVYGAGFGRTDNRYAVTGGTGLYMGVGGQLDVANLRHGDSLLAFEITR
jgi:hypothetical protein